MISVVGQGFGEYEGEPSSSGGTATQSLDQILSSIEKREIVAALRRANGQRTLAAQFLGISRSRLYRRMEALGIATEAPSPHL